MTEKRSAEYCRTACGLDGYCSNACPKPWLFEENVGWLEFLQGCATQVRATGQAVVGFDYHGCRAVADALGLVWDRELLIVLRAAEVVLIEELNRGND